jgi:hypothetical protein
LLPEEYGGNAGPVAKLICRKINIFSEQRCVTAIDFILGAYAKELLEYNDWFLADANSGVDEKKRPGKPKTSQDLFGLEGSFKQLTVD